MRVNKGIKTADLYDCRVAYLRELFAACAYPWELLPHIGEWIQTVTAAEVEGFTEISPSVWVGREVRIAPTATVEGPAILGHGTELRPGAYLRGNVITGEGCVLGNPSEFKNCILLDGAQAPHYNYVGDSVLGNKAHLGAGAVCSNLKADGKAVVIHGERDYPTELRKVGAFLADGADIVCGCVLNPGTVVGRRTSVYPLTALRGVYPPDRIVKSASVSVWRE